MAFDLRTFLRKAPKPSKIRYKTADDDERIIDLKGRRMWATAEESIRAGGAVTLECLDADGNVIRGHRLRDEDDLDAESEADAKTRYEDKLVTKAQREMASVLDRYGARLSEAFTAGAAAASSGQDKLVQLVEVLTENLTSAIVNVHNMSVNLATVIQSNAQTVAELQAAIAAAGGDSGQSSEAIRLITGVLAAKGVPMPGGTPPINGTPHRKPTG